VANGQKFLPVFPSDQKSLRLLILMFIFLFQRKG